MITFRRLIQATAIATILPQMAFAAPTVLQINSSQPDGSFAHVFLQEFDRRVSEALPKDIDVQIFMGNTLGSEEDVLQGLGFGTHHASLSASAVVQINPRAAIFDLPYLFADREAVKTFAASSAADMLAEGFEGQGMYLAALWDNGFRVITNSVRPIVTPEDLEGLKIRTPTNRQRIEMFNTLGANATPLSFGEVYSALDQGVVDGQENPAHVVESSRLYEVQEYMSISNHVYLPTFLVFGKPFLSGLSDNVRDELLTIAADMAEWTFDWGEETDSTVIADLRSEIEVNDVDFSAFQAAAAPLYQSATFVDVAGEDMVQATLQALGIE